MTKTRDILAISASEKLPGNVRVFTAQGQNYIDQELTLEEAANCILSIAKAMMIAAEMAGQQVPPIELPDNVVPLKRNA